MKRNLSHHVCLAILIPMAASVIAGCGGSGEEQNPAVDKEFLPLAVGNKWTYFVEETSDTSSVLTYSLEIISGSGDKYVAKYLKKNTAGKVSDEQTFELERKDGSYLKNGKILLPDENNLRIPAETAAAMFYDVGFPGIADSGMAEYSFVRDVAKSQYDYEWGAIPEKRSGTILYRWKKTDEEYRNGIGLFRFSSDMGTGGCAGSACGSSGTKIEGMLKTYIVNGKFHEVTAVEE